jgi:hypothetical protein
MIMFGRRPSHRIFDYVPRHYDPMKDEDERRKRRLGFRRKSRRLARKRSPVIWLVFIAVVIYLILKFGGNL